MSQKRFTLQQVGDLQVNSHIIRVDDGGSLEVDNEPVSGGSPSVPFSVGNMTVGSTAVDIGTMTFEGSSNVITGTNGLLVTTSGSGGLTLDSSTGTIDAGSNRILNVSTPTSSGDAVNKSYCDGNAGGGALTTTKYLSPSDIGGLHNYPGYTLVSGQAGKLIIIQRLDFFMDYNSAPYSGGPNLYLNYEGNWPASWNIPIDNDGGLGLLTATRDTHYSITNQGTLQWVQPGAGALLMADGAITGGNSPLTVRVTYELVDVLSAPPA